MGTATTRMRDYLDPLGLNPEFIDGIDGSGFGLVPENTQIGQCGFDDLAIEIDVTQSGDASAPVILTAVDLPAGIGADFSVNPVTPPGESLLTLSDLIAAGTGTFSFTLEGSSDDGDASVGLSVTLSDDAPALATITSPANGAVGVSIEPALTWTPANQAFNYQIEIARDAAFADVVYSANSFDTTYTVSSALETNSTYYLRVRASNDCGDGAWSAAVSFSTEALPGDCPLGTEIETLFFEDFADGSLPAGWSTAGSSGAVTWVPSADQAHSGGFSMFAENIASVSDQRLASPSVSLPADTEGLFLNFQNWQAIESAADGCFDGGLLEISTDGGANWATVGNEHILVREYDGDISGGFSNPLGDLPGWCGDPRDFWERYAINLDAWAGEDVQFRFRFGTDSSVSRVGWHVDSIEVRACVLDETDPVSVGGTVQGLAGSGLVLQNNGADDLAIAEDGDFTFATPLFPGDSYAVTVSSHPTSPAQLCEVSNGEGVIGDSDIDDVLVSCQTLAMLDTDRTEVGFGEVIEGNLASEIVVVSNAAPEGAMTLESATLNVSGDPVFEIAGGGCQVGSALEPGASCELELSFAPMTSGSYAGELTIASGDGQQALIPLSGQAVEPKPGVPEVSPQVVNFGSVPTNLQGTQTVTIANQAPADSAALDVAGTTLIGNPAVFQVDDSDCDQPVLPGASCTIALTFTPDSENALSAVLRIRIDGVNNNVSLQGRGIAPALEIFRDRFEAEPES